MRLIFNPDCHLVADVCVHTNSRTIQGCPKWRISLLDIGVKIKCAFPRTLVETFHG